MKTLTKEMQAAITPEIALKILKEGNKRFIDNLKINRNLLQQVIDTSDAQHPFAVILSCIDSRTSPELIFDQGLGDVFSIRIAGNIVNEDILGSIEYACEIAGAKIIVVLGHSKCGAIKGACDNIESGNLTALLNKIKPSVDAEKKVNEINNSTNTDFVESVSKTNVKRMTEIIMQRSPILRARVKNGDCGLVGGKHDISTGEIDFHKDTMLGFFKKNTKNNTTHQHAAASPQIRARL